jgi:hypothetical protein
MARVCRSRCSGGEGVDRDEGRTSTAVGVETLLSIFNGIGDSKAWARCNYLSGRW